MFSIAGMAEHPPASSAAQPDAQPAATHNSQAGAALPTVPTIDTTTEDTTSNHEPAPQPRAVTLSTPLATLLAAQYTSATEHMLLGKLQGRNQPSAGELSTWCKKHLHSTFLHITCLGLGYFEVAFSSRDGKEETLRRCGFFLGEIEVVFSPWQPSFEPEDPTCVNAFAYAIWVQFPGLNSLLRTKECLTEIGKHIGVVLMVEEDEINRAQTAGLRVRVLVSAEDLNALPTRLELPQIGNYGGKTCKVIYSGLPERCNACVTYAHSPQSCPLELEEEDSRDGQTGYPTSYCTKEWGMNVVKALQQRQTSPRSEECMVLKQANCILEDDPTETITDWGDAAAHGKCGNKGLAVSVNSQYTMTLSGPLSAPSSPSSHFQQEAASRGASSCAGISALSKKFSSRPAYDL